MERCAVFSRFGKDSVLLAALSYNVGVYRLLGGGRLKKSRLVRKLEAGDRDIYANMCRSGCIAAKSSKDLRQGARLSSPCCSCRRQAPAHNSKSSEGCFGGFSLPYYIRSHHYGY